MWSAADLWVLIVIGPVVKIADTDWDVHVLLYCGYVIIVVKVPVTLE